MTPRQAGALRNTGHLALDRAQEGKREARVEGLTTAPWDKAIREAKQTIKLAEEHLVMI